MTHVTPTDTCRELQEQPKIATLFSPISLNNSLQEKNLVRRDLCQADCEVIIRHAVQLKRDDF